MKIVNETTAESGVITDDDVKMIISALRTVVAINQVTVDIGNDKDGKALYKIERANRIMHTIAHLSIV